MEKKLSVDGAHRIGHYKALCYSKTVTSVESGSLTPFLDTAFMDTVFQGEEKAWFTTIRMGKKETRFKLDTGAEVTAITQDTYRHQGKPKLNCCMTLPGTPCRGWES